MKKILAVLIGIVWLSCACVAFATPLNVDQYIVASDPYFDTSNLSATVEISQGPNSSSFYLTLTNNTPYSTLPYDNPSVVTLTGVGFQLPSAVNISGGSASSMTPEGQNNTGYSASQLWGYSNDSGGGPFANIATLPTNAVVATLAAATDSAFQPGGPNINGPSGGVAPTTYWTYYPASWPAYYGDATFTINLSGLVISDFTTFAAGLEAGNVVVSFSSPTPTASVPEPGTLLLLGIGLIGVAGIGRKKFNT